MLSYTVPMGAPNVPPEAKLLLREINSHADLFKEAHLEIKNEHGFFDVYRVSESNRLTLRKGLTNKKLMAFIADFLNSLNGFRAFQLSKEFYLPTANDDKDIACGIKNMPWR